jgi:hypothetical protein
MKTLIVLFWVVMTILQMNISPHRQTEVKMEAIISFNRGPEEHDAEGHCKGEILT